MNGFKFLKFKVYLDAKSFLKEVEILLNKNVFKFQYVLQDQLKRALHSIILNIAEGSSRKSDKDFRRFLFISMGSLNEVVACIDLIRDKRLISEKEFDLFIEKAQNIARQLSGFIKSLK